MVSARFFFFFLMVSLNGVNFFCPDQIPCRLHVVSSVMRLDKKKKKKRILMPENKTIDSTLFALADARAEYNGTRALVAVAPLLMDVEDSVLILIYFHLALLY